MKTDWDVCMAYRRGQPQPYVEQWEQPLRWWMVAKAYELWCDMSFPIMKHIERWHRNLFEARYEARGEDYIYIPLTNRQDIRWDDLYNKGRVNLAVFHISLDDYNKYVGERSAWKEEPAAAEATA